MEKYNNSYILLRDGRFFFELGDIYYQKYNKENYRIKNNLVRCYAIKISIRCIVLTQYKIKGSHYNGQHTDTNAPDNDYHKESPAKITLPYPISGIDFPFPCLCRDISYKLLHKKILHYRRQHRDFIFVT